MNVSKRFFVNNTSPVNFIIRYFRGDRKNGCKTIALLFDYDSKNLHPIAGQMNLNHSLPLAQIYQEFGSYIEEQLKTKYGISVIKATDDGNLEESIQRLEKDQLPFVLKFKPDLTSGVTYLRSSATKLEEQIPANQVVDRIALYLQIVEAQDVMKDVK